MTHVVDFHKMSIGQAEIGQLDEQVFGVQAPYIAVKVWENTAEFLANRTIKFQIAAQAVRRGMKEIYVVQLSFSIAGSPQLFQLLLNIQNQVHQGLLNNILANGFVRIYVFEQSLKPTLRLKPSLDVSGINLILRELSLADSWTEGEFSAVINTLEQSPQIEWCLATQQGTVPAERIATSIGDNVFAKPQLSGESFPSSDRCIYCGIKPDLLSDLTKEHIIPKGLGGNLTLPHSSCKSCQNITSSFELFCQRPMLGTFRIITKLKKSTSTDLEFEIVRQDGTKVREMLSILDCPGVCLGFRFPIPLLFQGKPPSDQLEGELVAKQLGKSFAKYLQSNNSKVKVGTINSVPFCKMLAKIAYSYAVAQVGLKGFHSLVTDFILGKCDMAGTFFVGGRSDTAQLQSCESLHQLFLSTVIFNKTKYLVVSIQLFSVLAMPWYIVIVGECD